jgi:hypothetical protein
MTNNCEHLCEWCLRGTARSFQVEGQFTLSTDGVHVALKK